MTDEPITPPSGPFPTIEPPKARAVADMHTANAVAASSGLVGIPAAGIAAYLASAYLHPGGHPLPADIAAPLGAGIATVATYLFHIARIALDAFARKVIET